MTSALPTTNKRAGKEKQEELLAPHEDGETQSKLSLHGLLHMYLSGTIVGVANAAVFHPVDSIRIRYFFLPRSKKSVHLDDIRGVSFWKGLGFNMFSTAIKQMAFYPTQELMKQAFVFKAGLAEERGQFFSSICAGIVLGLLAAPINVIKVPLQSGVSVNFTVSQVCRDVYREHGLPGFYRGGLGIVLRDTVWSTTYFPIFGFLRQSLSAAIPPSSLSNHLASLSSGRTSDNTATEGPGVSSQRNLRGIVVNSISSVTASMTAMLVSYPFDSSRLYRQKYGGRYNFWYGFLKSFQPSAANYRSLAASLIRVPLATAFSHTLYLFLEHK